MPKTNTQLKTKLKSNNHPVTSTHSFVPPQKKLEKYAKILIDFALNSGKGVKKGEVVLLQFDLDAMPLAIEAYRRILACGGHPILKPHEEYFQRIMLDEANKEQLQFFPEPYMKSLVDTIDHRMFIFADRDPNILKGVDPKRIMLSQKSSLKMKKWLFDKEDQGKMTWVLALYGTDGLAKEAHMSAKELWDQIDKACFLNEADPVKKWKQVFRDLEKLRVKLSKMPIEKLHLEAKDTDLWITLGQERQWLAGSGRNIPSFEIFTSPDWRGTEGHVFFDAPLYRYGNVIKDIRLTFKDGRVVDARAKKNEKLLKEMIAQENADKIGEYSLTDIRYSHIDRFTANTLYDENYGGKYGNTHLAVGSSFHEAFTGNVVKATDKDWERLGFNESVEHCDILATTKRTVTAQMRDGSEKVIYKDGLFLI